MTGHYLCHFLHGASGFQTGLAPYVSLPKQKSQQKTDVCFRNLPAPAGKILAVATGVTAGPANLGRMTSCFAELLLRMLAKLLKKKLPDIYRGHKIFFSPIKQLRTPISHQLHKKTT